MENTFWRKWIWPSYRHWRKWTSRRWRFRWSFHWERRVPSLRRIWKREWRIWLSLWAHSEGGGSDLSDSHICDLCTKTEIEINMSLSCNTHLQYAMQNMLIRISVLKNLTLNKSLFCIFESNSVARLCALTAVLLMFLR